MQADTIVLRILDNHGLTRQQLANMLGYRSKNSVLRVISGNVSEDLQLNFYRKILACTELTLSQEERDMLEIEMDGLSDGRMNLSARRDLTNMLLRRKNAAQAPSEAGTADHGVINITTGVPFDLYAGWQSARRLRVTAFGFLPSAVTNAADRLSPTADVSVTYYGYDSGSIADVCAQIRRISPFMFQPWFTAVSTDGDETRYAFAEAAHADRTEYAVILPRGRNGCIYVPVESTPPLFHRDLVLSPPRKNTENIIPEQKKQDEKEDYPVYLKYCLGLEKNRSIFQLKPDIGIDLVPADIQITAMREGPMGNIPDVENISDKLINIQNARYTNALRKNCLQTRVFSYEALHRFCETGMTEDHFWGFRPFTPAERRNILTRIADNAEGKNSWRFHFLRDEFEFPQGEAVGYDGIGVTFIMKDTDYNIRKDNMEIMVERPDLAAFYLGYFRKYFLENYALSKPESLKMLRELIAGIR